MSCLTVRRLLVDLEAPMPRHWFGGDPFATALFNALSMSFPVGEQFFIDAVRAGLAALPQHLQEKLAPEVRGFAGQEATHRRIHTLFNAHLEREGLVNDWGPRAAARLASMQGADPRHGLAITAAYEHFTALLADWMLDNAAMFEGTEPRLATLWLWHSAEESEHRATAFELYRACGGNHAWRITWFRRVTILFVGDTLRQTLANLRRDGTLWTWPALRGAFTLLCGRRGLLRHAFVPWLRYLRRDFHPREHASDRARHWLRDNAAAFAAVAPPGR